ncbi:MAG: hypothetical protein P1U89_17850 [Verrucomicrobiales bacterium]|nr:hypothetical protein [Verrucomicrobiales bacterium]
MRIALLEDMNNQSNITHRPEIFGISPVVAVIAAVLSFTSGPLLGMFFAFVAITFGIVGVVTSLSPTRRGGVISTMSACAGFIGIVAAFIKGVIWIL